MQTCLANHLITSETSIACLDITDWGVWPSSQNMDLFYSYRRYLGERRSLGNAHFIFTASEANEFRNILHLELISLFDVAGASTTTDFRFYASHDEYIDVTWYRRRGMARESEVVLLMAGLKERLT